MSRRQAGFTLIETTITVAVVAIVIAAGTSLWLGSRPYSLSATVIQFTAIVDEARALAATSGDGATLSLQSDGQGGFVVALYASRPTPSMPLAANPLRSTVFSIGIAGSANGVALTLPFGLFVSSSGTVSAANWEPGATIASEPPCAGSLSLTFANGPQAQTRTIDCNDARLE